MALDSCAAKAGLVPPPAFLTVEPLRRRFGGGGGAGYLEFVSSLRALEDEAA